MVQSKPPITTKSGLHERWLHRFLKKQLGCTGRCFLGAERQIGNNQNLAKWRLSDTPSQKWMRIFTFTLFRFFFRGGGRPIFLPGFWIVTPLKSRGSRCLGSADRWVSVWGFPSAAQGRPFKLCFFSVWSIFTSPELVPCFCFLHFSGPLCFPITRQTRYVFLLGS